RTDRSARGTTTVSPFASSGSPGLPGRSVFRSTRNSGERPATRVRKVSYSDVVISARESRERRAEAGAAAVPQRRGRRRARRGGPRQARGGGGVGKGPPRRGEQLRQARRAGADREAARRGDAPGDLGAVGAVIVRLREHVQLVAVAQRHRPARGGRQRYGRGV